MTDYSRKPYETKNLTNQRISTDFIEDSLINSFIEREVEININDGTYSEYASANVEDKAKIEMEAFKYFNDKYNAKGQDSPRIQNIRFENFVKICNPERDFLSALRKGDPDKNNPASVWNDKFNQDVGMYRKAAIEGYKRALENLGPEEGSV